MAIPKSIINAISKFDTSGIVHVSKLDRAASHNLIVTTNASKYFVKSGLRQSGRRRIGWRPCHLSYAIEGLFYKRAWLSPHASAILCKMYYTDFRTCIILEHVEGSAYVPEVMDKRLLASNLVRSSSLIGSDKYSHIAFNVAGIKRGSLEHLMTKRLRVLHHLIGPMYADRVQARVKHLERSADKTCRRVTVHGDLHRNNLIVDDKTGDIRVIDWQGPRFSSQWFMNDAMNLAIDVVDGDVDWDLVNVIADRMGEYYEVKDVMPAIEYGYIFSLANTMYSRLWYRVDIPNSLISAMRAL